MRVLTGLLVLCFVGSGCGSDSQSEGEKACQDLQAKLAECHLTTPGVCNSSQPCTVNCAAKADCAQLSAGTPSGSYLDCVAACSGAGPGDFICKDGRAFVNKAGVCDGKFQCQDGSDEADCSAGTGGAPSGTGGAAGAAS